MPDLTSPPAASTSGTPARVPVQQMLYTYKPWWFAHGDILPELTRWPLWLAAYGKNDGNPGTESTAPAPWSDWLVWQYSSNGTVPGVAGRCDVNLARPGFLGSPPPDEEDDDVKSASDQEADIRVWFRAYLGRNPNPPEMPLHLWVYGVAGAGTCLAGIIDSPEGQTYYERTKG